MAMSPGEGGLKRLLQDGPSRGEARRLLGWHESRQWTSQMTNRVRIWMHSPWVPARRMVMKTAWGLWGQRPRAGVTGGQKPKVAPALPEEITHRKNRCNSRVQRTKAGAGRLRWHESCFDP